ncbi:hypothetical protein COB52_03495 [Candidatus Kaiserbacteria bacterium]|nr:MAG: hypothetical protein COB52_03495 [Candidatus Kaiserbacteria bacterium]
MKLLIIGLVIVIAGGWYFVSSKETVKEGVMMEKDHIMEGEEVMMKKEGDAMIMEGSFTGKVIAGSSSPLLEYNTKDYEMALKSDRLVVLYYYASWCPLCKIEFKSTRAAFDALEGEDVVGFRVHFNDGSTTKEMENLAREYGVAYQHTKVFIKDGERVLKSPETWGLARYAEEFTNNLK